MADWTLRGISPCIPRIRSHRPLPFDSLRTSDSECVGGAALTALRVRERMKHLLKGYGTPRYSSSVSSMSTEYWLARTPTTTVVASLACSTPGALARRAWHGMGVASHG